MSAAPGLFSSPEEQRRFGTYAKHLRVRSGLTMDVLLAKIPNPGIARATWYKVEKAEQVDPRSLVAVAAAFDKTFDEMISEAMSDVWSDGVERLSQKPDIPAAIPPVTHKGFRSATEVVGKGLIAYLGRPYFSLAKFSEKTPYAGPMDVTTFTSETQLLARLNDQQTGLPIIIVGPGGFGKTRMAMEVAKLFEVQPGHIALKMEKNATEADLDALRQSCAQNNQRCLVFIDYIEAQRDKTSWSTVYDYVTNPANRPFLALIATSRISFYNSLQREQSLPLYQGFERFNDAYCDVLNLSRSVADPFGQWLNQWRLDIRRQITGLEDDDDCFDQISRAPLISVLLADIKARGLLQGLTNSRASLGRAIQGLLLQDSNLWSNIPDPVDQVTKLLCCLPISETAQALFHGDSQTSLDNLLDSGFVYYDRDDPSEAWKVGHDLISELCLEGDLDTRPGRQDARLQEILQFTTSMDCAQSFAGLLDRNGAANQVLLQGELTLPKLTRAARFMAQLNATPIVADDLMNKALYSVSVDYPQTVKVIKSLPKLSSKQLAELDAVFDEEREKFTELCIEGPEDVAKALCISFGCRVSDVRTALDMWLDPETQWADCRSHLDVLEQDPAWLMAIKVGESLRDVLAEIEESNKPPEEVLQDVKEALSQVSGENRTSAKAVVDGMLRSLSLNTEEKNRVLTALPGLDAEKLAALIDIFEEERPQWIKLALQFPQDVGTLLLQRYHGDLDLIGKELEQWLDPEEQNNGLQEFLKTHVSDDPTARLSGLIDAGEAALLGLRGTGNMDSGRSALVLAGNLTSACAKTGQTAKITKVGETLFDVLRGTFDGGFADDAFKILTVQSKLLHHLGDPDGARRLLETALSFFQAHGSFAQYCEIAGDQLQHLRASRDHDGAALLARELLEQAENSAAPESELGRVFLESAMNSAAKGDYASAIPLYEKACGSLADVTDDLNRRRAKLANSNLIEAYLCAGANNDVISFGNRCLSNGGIAENDRPIIQFLMHLADPGMMTSEVLASAIASAYDPQKTKWNFDDLAPVIDALPEPRKVVAAHVLQALQGQMTPQELHERLGLAS